MAAYHYDPRSYFKDRNPYVYQSAPTTPIPQEPVIQSVATTPAPQPEVREELQVTEPKRSLRREIDQAEDEVDQQQGEASVAADLARNDGDEGVEDGAADFLYQTLSRDGYLRRMEGQCHSMQGPKGQGRYERSPSSAPLLRGPKGKAKRMSIIAEEEKEEPVPQACFGCDIHTESNEDFSAAEKECKQLIIEGGGSIIEDHEYPGGFLFNFPVNVALPLTNGDETKGHGYIEIKPYGPANPDTPPMDLIDEDEDASIETATAMTITTPTKAEMQPKDLSPTNDLSSTTGPDQEISQISDEPMPFEQALNQFVFTNNPESSEEKVWPRPLNSTEKGRSTNWIKAKAAERDAKQQKLMNEANQGTDMEVAEAADQVTNADYGNAADRDEILGAIGMDGFTKLADWMGAGGPLGRGATVRSPLP